MSIPDSQQPTLLNSNYLLYDQERLDVIGDIDWERVVSPYNPDNVTPAGYDFTLDAVQGFGYMRPKIYQDSKVLPLYESRATFTEGSTGGKRMYHLPQGIYMVRFLELVRIPDNYMSYMRPRSTLTRCGVTLETAVWDPGYEGISHCLMNVLNPQGIEIEHGTRIGHMVMHRKVVPAMSILYNGQYQKEGIE